jgi:hypothetical protein
MAGEFFGTGPLPANPNSSCYGTLPVRWFLAYQAPSSIFCVQSGNELRTTGINDDGHVVGWERPTPSAEYRSWISRNGVKTIVPKPGAPKGSTSICGMKAAGMNRYDVVVGSASVCYPSSTIQRGYMWNGLSTSSLLLGVLPGGNSSQAYDVNAWRIITGSSEQLVEGGTLPDLIRDRAFVYHATMGMVALPIPEGYVPLYTDCEALAVSALDYGDYAHIAGYCTKNSKKHAVVWKVRFEKTYLELNF